MEQADLRSWERQCTQDDMPKCRAACPLQMDVRPFLERMAHGDTPGARKVLERHLPLPGVLGRICEPVRNGLCPAGAWRAARRWRAGTGLCVAVRSADAESAASPKKQKGRGDR